MNVTDSAATWLDLYDWRERVARMYRERNAALQAGEAADAVLERFRAQKNDLFKTHPQSPFGPQDRATFTGLRYFPYDPSFCVQALLTPLAMQTDTSSPPVARFASAHGIPHRPAASLEFEISGAPVRLMVYWLDVYGGGLFLPFRDATGPEESYGAGRYLFDTVKGSDFIRLPETREDPSAVGYSGGQVLLDFNYSYNPSCAYDPRWICPLAPRENWLAVPISAGEQNYHDSPAISGA
jgi:uncharacterized protein (DUF1684 family)